MVTRECQDVRELMDSYLGGELLVETNHDVLRHLSRCPACTADLERRQQLRTLLKDANAVDLDAAAVGRVTEQVRMAIGRDRRWSWRGTRRWVAAAAIVAAVLLYGWPRTRVEAAAYRDAVENHRICALTFPKTAAYNPQRVARRLLPPFADLASLAGRPYGAFHLVDAHTCPYHGRNYAHLILRSDDRTVSVFVDPSGGGPMPPATEYQGFEAAGLGTRAHQIVVVSDLARVEHLGVAGLVMPAVTAAIEKIER